MMHFNSTATSTNDTNYSCHIEVVELFSPITWGPYHGPHMIINSLEGRDTQMHAHILTS